ncbi:PAS domain-containing sensor histidine kinase [Methylobacterium sp. 092160098-2]|uniref:sensor histidine kinase n=1 Tax=Methylobacterium sp. 092160098-2 TaxID=3025129 RepID=UPI002381A6E9|nr:PAS domain-containing sensor histidine kinase [Methylobacterium sp. 092160098-2]MDE4910735.1 PAS domain-containing sensor histidine kinase [Methylobacterium sp. 092160098-2]
MPTLTIKTVLTSLIDDRLAGLVHESVADNAPARARHQRFLVSRLATGAVMMVGLPPYLLWRGVPSGFEVLAIASLLLPVFAAVLLARTGSLWIAHAVSSAGLTGLVVALAGVTGGAASPAAVWLVAIPLEALVSGSLRATIAASVMAVLGVLTVVALGAWAGALPVMDISAGIALPAFAITAIGHVAAQALEHMRNEGVWRERLRDNEARDRLLLSAIDDLVTWHDRNGRVLEASVSATRLLGSDPARLRGHGLLERVHVADRPAFLKAVSDVAATGRPATLPLRLHVEAEAGRPDGASLIHAEMRAHRIEHGPHEAAMAVVAVTRDMTEHHRHAVELERARAEAERADAIKGRFLANVTHELRTPLNAIIGFSEVLAGQGAVSLGPDQAREYAGIIGASGHHLLGVVNTLLDMSRIQSGNFDCAPECFDIAGLLRACCDLMRLKADAAGIVLTVPPSGPVEITADPAACRQVLINLISNAVKFTPRGGRVDLSLRRGAGSLDIVVADTGVGIGTDDLPKLGTPFFQAGSGGYKRQHEGTGLGLSVVQGLVGLHGGALLIESAPQVGTVVTVTLPLVCPAPAADHGPAPIRTAVRGAPVSRRVVRLPLGLFDAEPSAASVPADPVLRRTA